MIITGYLALLAPLIFLLIFIGLNMGRVALWFVVRQIVWLVSGVVICALLYVAAWVLIHGARLAGVP